MKDPGLFLEIVLSCAILAGVWLYIRRMRSKISEKFRKIHGRPVCSDIVNYYGQQSRKGFEWRGMSLLWLTPSEIILYRFIPRKKLVIPVASVIDVHSSRHFTGKPSLKPLLNIQYARDDGHHDVIACAVSDYDKWERAIRRVQRQRRGIAFDVNKRGEIRKESVR